MLRRDGRLRRPGAVAHLWPLARAFVAALDLALMREGGPVELGAIVQARLAALERYWDPRVSAYASDPPGAWVGGDVYYDDNAWAGLALIQLERLRPGGAPLDRAAALAAFARTGWSHDPELPSPGGVYWVAQGRGLGARNHDRNAISTAPNGQLILRLAALGGGADGDPSPAQMADWVLSALAGETGLIRDKIRGDGAIDPATWSYNQGSMIGLLAQLGRVAASETLAARALDHYTARDYAGEPAEFVAIFVRNLLILHARSGDSGLRSRIEATVHERAAAEWSRARDGVAAGGRATLLEQSALVSLQALAAWDPADYDRLA
jgi:predicted alpha-1,6-mannanase (GH76 family)